MTTAASSYEITEGGLLRSLERALHLTRGDGRDWLRRCAFFLVITYLPVLLLGLGWRIIAGDWLPPLAHVHTHVRALVSVPLLLAAEVVVETRARGAGAYVLASRLVGEAREGHEAAIERTARLRDSHVVEVALLAIALGTSFLEGTYFGAASLFQWLNEPSIVVFRFLLLRWIWRWLLWGVFLGRLARLRLELRATHPDRLAGLAPLLGPSHAIAVVAAAGSSAIASGWIELMVRHQRPLSAFYDMALTYVLVMVVLALLPACVFIPSLYRARKDGLGAYGAFAHRFVGAFEERWFEAGGKEALGAPDLSSLADLGGSYTVVAEIRLFPWTPRLVLVIVLGALLPMVPLMTIEIGLPELLQKLAGQLR